MKTKRITMQVCFYIDVPVGCDEQQLTLNVDTSEIGLCNRNGNEIEGVRVAYYELEEVEVI